MFFFIWNVGVDVLYVHEHPEQLTTGRQSLPFEMASEPFEGMYDAYVLKSSRHQCSCLLLAEHGAFSGSAYDGPHPRTDVARLRSVGVTFLCHCKAMRSLSVFLFDFISFQGASLDFTVGGAKV